eukprot:scaffold25401_cov147-Cylindrotheca_fusiformis.AAC.1
MLLTTVSAVAPPCCALCFSPSQLQFFFPVFVGRNWRNATTLPRESQLHVHCLVAHSVLSYDVMLFFWDEG